VFGFKCTNSIFESIMILLFWQPLMFSASGQKLREFEGENFYPRSEARRLARQRGGGAE
jgi:hypothetical protein